MTCSRREQRPFIAWDAELKGFGLRVLPSGIKSFVVEYRPGEGGRGVNKRKLTLGRYGSMTAEQARKAAGDALARVRLGEDPQADKARQRGAATVTALIEAFLDGHVNAKLKLKTRVDYAIVLNRLRAANGNLKAAALTATHLGALHREMAGMPYQANKMLATVSSLYAWAERHDYVPEGYPNPARKIVRYREQGRERFLTSEELARLGEALREGETIGLAPKADNRRVVLDPFAAAAVRLLILTGARLREILHAKCSKFQFSLWRAAS